MRGSLPYGRPGSRPRQEEVKATKSKPTTTPTTAATLRRKRQGDGHEHRSMEVHGWVGCGRERHNTRLRRRWHSASGGVEHAHTDGCLGKYGYAGNRHHLCKLTVR